MAAAFNHGYTQLWSQARLPQWANRWDPATGHYGGGFGYLNVGGRVLSTLYLDRPRGARTTRTFGTGYYEHTLRAAGLDVLEKVYAPFGDDPLLLHDVTIRNRTRAPRRVSWFEYWDVNPWIEAVDSGRAVGTPTWSPGLRTLAVPQAAGDLGDQRPLSIFAAALSGPVGGHETSTARFFGTDTRQAPAAVRADRLSRSTAAAGGRLFAIRAPLRLRPGQSVTLRYAYGMAHPERVAPLVRKYRRAGDPFTRSERRWAAWLPRADFGRGQGVGRARAPVGRLPAPLGLGLRGGVRAPHDHAGRLLPVQLGRQPRVAKLAALHAADGLRRAVARAGDPALHGGRAIQGAR